MNREEALGLLRTALADPIAEFRDGQWEAVDVLANQRSKLLVVQRTGWGKSAVYFIATRILRNKDYGPTIIISPLLALMRNQVEAAGRLGIHAITINSTNAAQFDTLRKQVLSGEADCLLVSPERLANEQFVDEVLLPIAGRIGLLVVDEAHCISDWGHDFRPDYRRLLNILRQMPPNMPVLATTATANDRVVEDITAQLGDIAVQRGSLVRESLSLQNIILPDQATRLAWLAENIPNMEGAGIVYTLTKRDAEQVMVWLNKQGIDARAYHGDIKHPDFEDSTQYREHLEGLLRDNKLKVLVATTALGMGYDKPDLNFVIHYQAPGSIITYYQQVGRAGRGIDESYGILLAGAEDEEIHDYFRRTAFPGEEQVHGILSMLETHDGLSIFQFQEKLNMRSGQIKKVLEYLGVESPAPVFKKGAQWVRTPVRYQLDHDKIDRLTRQREEEWEQIQDYIRTGGCLMEFLRSALDDPESAPCGKCANCLDGSLFSLQVSRETVIVATRFLGHAELPFTPKARVAANAFPEYGFRGNLPRDHRASEGRILSRWGDAGWGGQVEEDKHTGHFREELVTAMMEMIQQRWQPQPPAEWVTCVPSQNHPKLVPDYAGRLAQALELPFYPVISKVRDNQPQKLQNNRFHQCQNLDGAFAIADNIPTGPVLLVDDIIDSGWTMTVLAALLRREGSGLVYPVALASTATGG